MNSSNVMGDHSSKDDSPKEQASVSIIVDYDRTVNYAMQQNDVPVIKSLKIVNESETALQDVYIRLIAEPVFALPWEGRISLINPTETFNFGTVDIGLLHDFLASLTERVTGSLHVEVSQNNTALAHIANRIDVLAYDEWNGLQSIPDIIAAFVTPNHPAIESVLSEAADILGKWTGSSSISGYQSRDSHRVVLTTAAIFTALQAKGIKYINPPASFEENGQKIRLPERIFEGRLATCLDLSVLVASCLEQAGLHPLIVITNGHAFVGVWLEDETFADVATDDLLRLRKRVELGKIYVFETTLLTGEQKNTFEQAVKTGVEHLEDVDAFRCVIDIRRARKSRIRPLPIRIEIGSGRALPSDNIVNDIDNPPIPSFSTPSTVRQAEPAETAKDTPATRLDRWKRKLLDLTLHNRLLNFRESKKNLPILCENLGTMEDALADGVSFKIYPRLRDIGEIDQRNADIHSRRSGKDSLDEMLKEEFQSHRLHADVTDVELNRRLLEIYREAKLSLEESGANTLYLALGFLGWYETDNSPQKRLAPIILIPLEIDRHSVKEGFTIRKGDDEPIVNITLLTHLSTNFDLNIDGLDPIPRDDHGIDVPFILRKFREAIVNIDRWEVLELAYIGHFSFTKFLMWRDLEVRADDLQRNAIVHHLIHTPSEAFPDDGNFPDPDKLDETHSLEATFCPLSADSSQLAAVYAAGAGKSFVLHGPPGTGKSQTIANIIAHNLALGKTVLFVSEKRAALEVVHRRLTASGLEPFCLELHSNKSNKKGVLSQLELSLNTYVDHSSDEWLRTAQRLTSSRQELNAFVKALHTIRESGESVFHGISQLIRYREVPLVKLELPSIAGTDRNKLETLRDIVRRLQLAAAQIGHPTTNPWAAVACETWTPELVNNIEQLLKDLHHDAKTLYDVLGRIAVDVGINGNEYGKKDLENLLEISKALLNCPSLPSGILLSEDWKLTKSELLKTFEHGRMRDKLRKEVFAIYTEGILSADLKTMQLEWNAAKSTWFVQRWLKHRKVRQVLTNIMLPGKALQNEEIPHHLELALSLFQENQYLTSKSTWADEILGAFWQKSEADWDMLEKCLGHADDLYEVASQVSGTDSDLATRYRNNWASLASGMDQYFVKEPLRQHLKAYIDAYDAFMNVEKGLSSLLVVDFLSVFGIADKKDYLKQLVELGSIWLNNLNGLRAWCYWRSARKAAIDAHLKKLVDAYEFQGLSTDKIIETFTRGYYQSWCDATISAEPALSGFFSRDFEDKIRIFRELDDNYTKLTNNEILARLALKLPKGSVNTPNSENGILRRQIQKKAGHLPVRSLIQKIPNLLPRLKPCLLMSPISVAQYLDPAHPPFDLVVFDEASQIPVWDAVGAIARGKEAIIVGDPMQLPPTNFFTRIESGDGGDYDDSLVEDLESILDDCIAAQLPERYLNWHYRSRHESLIAFSNFHYYGNRLLTFPSPHQELGVSFRPIVGEYDKGKARTNRAEAKAVVAEVVRRLLDSKLSQYSIGIVTFSLPQQILIDDLLEEARRKQTEIDPYFSDSVTEPVFVKNLENVQGDERDIILFSVCYGPDATGRVSMNFGPLNRDGGERRLNVAITRARMEVIVFSTLRAEHIDLSRTRAKGVADFRCFLDYAERGFVAISERRATDSYEDYESPFEEQVCEALQKEGYTVHAQVGCAGYRIDLGVVDPVRPGRYILGIECDGANYHSSKAARDRDKLRESVLRGLGWKLHRIWSTDWWERPKEELTRVLVAIEDAIQKSAMSEEAVEKPSIIVENPPPPSASMSDKIADQKMQGQHINNKQFSLPIYETFIMTEIKGTQDDFYNVKSDSIICSLIDDVVKKESPISLVLAARRVAEHWGIARITSRVIRRVRSLVEKNNIRVMGEKDNQFLWASSQNPETYSLFRVPVDGENLRRNIADLPPQEIANATLFVLEQSVSLPATDLIRETARLLGFQRAGREVDVSIRRGIETLLEKSVAKEDNGMIVHVGQY